MTAGRWVRIQSNVLDHPLFANSERSESDAWLWLIANAAWEDTKHRVAGEVFDVPAGSLFVTLRGLQKAWNWRSDKRVRTFLKTLELHEMITQAVDAKKTQLTICNYSRFQVSGRKEDAERTQTFEKMDAKKTQTSHCNQKEKDGSGRKEDANFSENGRTKYTSNISSLRSDIEKPARNDREEFIQALSGLLSKDMIEDIIRHRRAKKSTVTGRVGTLLANELRKCDDPIEAVEMMIVRGWATVKADWVRNANGGSNRGGNPQSRRPNAIDALGGLLEQDRTGHAGSSFENHRGDVKRLSTGAVGHADTSENLFGRSQRLID